ncbi:MAG: cysteine hydrolase [Thermomicrobiales bacterium]|nr:cysteine hydrolase [Thermomicrobiales bacterium]MCO5221700.1 cysteine hydrolase [Thermomicrobiales bacterium]
METRLGRRAILAKLAITPAATIAAAQAIPLAWSSTPVAGATQSPVTTLEIETDRTALLILDFQPRWLETLSDPHIVVERAAAALTAARAAGMLVAFCRVAFEAADYAAVPEGNIIFDAISRPVGALDDGNSDLEITPELAPRSSEKVIRKTRVSAFARTDLDEWLRAMEIDTLLLAGISTSGVILSTVCEGADLDYRLIVLQDACADTDPVIQQTLMQRVFPQRAEVATVEQIVDVFEKVLSPGS